MIKVMLNDLIVGQKEIGSHKNIDAYPNLDYSIKNFSVFARHVVFLTGP